MYILVNSITVSVHRFYVFLFLSRHHSIFISDL